jgi:hypothetical protein
MAEPDRGVERRLADLAGSIEWPPTPDLRAGVRTGIARARRRRLRRLLIAATLAIALAGGSATAAYLELRGATIQQVPGLPSPSPTGTGPLGARLDLGQRYASLAAAEAAAGFHARVPAALGQPDEAWFRESPGVITLVYRPRPGLPASSDPRVGALVMEARASVSAPSFGKLTTADTHVQPVTVNGGQGFWITGAPHGFFFYGVTGETDTFRLAGDVLIWNQADLVVRIESGLDEQGSLRVAGTVP